VTTGQKRKENKAHFVKLIRPFGALAVASVLWLASSSCDRAAQPSPRHDKALCTRQLETVYQAIQACRRDHKDLPDWLSDLVPKHLATTNLLICPGFAHSPKAHPYRELGDPCIPTAYVYDFSPALWVGRPMRDFKRRQMGLVGGRVSIVRCHFHDKALSLSFDGVVFESPVTWESSYADVLDPAELSVERLFGGPNSPRKLQDGSSPWPPEEHGPTETALVGKSVPGNFKLPLLNGGQFELPSQSTNLLLLDFWATWCGPCQQAMPILAGLAKDYSPRGVRYVAVNLREEPAAIRRYLTSNKLDIEVALDGDCHLAEALQVRGIPAMVLLDRDGIVERVPVGTSPDLKAELSGARDDLLAGKKAAAQVITPTVLLALHASPGGRAG
jgi:thiol-disulfide isomerase/thioredoxin